MSGSTLTRDKLTAWEWSALDGPCNIADGHSHQGQNSAQLDIVNNLSSLFQEAERTTQTALQENFCAQFFELAGQRFSRKFAPPLYHYSSSVSVEVVANYLRRDGKSVALLHPTFDNIPAILIRHGVKLVALEEQQFLNPSQLVESLSADAIFLVLPNNPTGFELTRTQFQSIVRSCKRRGILIILDFSFRFFSSLTKWDQYEILYSNQCDFIGIEDTGKTWPTLDLKIGFIVSSPSIYPELASITDDVLLNVSPFIFALLTEYISAEGQIPRQHTIRQIAKSNRMILRSALKTTALEVFNPSSRISVEWLKLPHSWNSMRFCEWLETKQISVLPGTPFFWYQPKRGDSFIRVALMRPQPFFRDAVSKLSSASIEYQRLVARGRRTGEK